MSMTIMESDHMPGVLKAMLGQLLMSELNDCKVALGLQEHHDSISACKS